MQQAKLLGTLFMGISACMIATPTLGQTYATVDSEIIELRESATDDAESVGTLEQGDEVEIVEQVDKEWVEITLEDDQTAFVNLDDLEITETKGVIDGDNVRLRTYPDIDDSRIIKKVHTDDEVTILYEVDGWYKVIQDGDEGFVSGKYVEAEFEREIPSKRLKEIEAVVSEESEDEEENEEENEDASTLGQQIAADAIGFVGGRYVYGGNSLTSGVDCSGFVQQIMKRHGVSVSRSSRIQYASDGEYVRKSDLEPGDLTFYGYDGHVSHVAIYIGNGQIVHANTSSTGILISDLYSTGKPYIGAKRVL